MQSTQTVIRCDILPAVSWTTCMATWSDSPGAYWLLKGFAMQQRLTCSAPVIFYVSRIYNLLADVTSRPITGIVAHFHLFEQSPSAMCPQTFLTIFNSKYPLPQQRFWNYVQPPSALWYKLISMLRGQQLALQQWMIALDVPRGSVGLPMPNSVKLTPGCNIMPIPFNRPTSLPLLPGFELASMGTQSKLVSSL
jgi:hypothetical protein